MLVHYSKFTDLLSITNFVLKYTLKYKDCGYCYFVTVEKILFIWWDGVGVWGCDKNPFRYFVHIFLFLIRSNSNMFIGKLEFIKSYTIDNHDIYVPVLLTIFNILVFFLNNHGLGRYESTSGKMIYK